MTLKSISDALSCSLHYGPQGWGERTTSDITAGDLMSEVLVHEGDQTLLVTALNSDQVIRTADIVEASGVLLVNGKDPQKSVIDLARDSDIPLLSTKLSMYAACSLISRLEEGE